MSDTFASSNYIELAADIVSAYVSNNSVPSGDLPMLISDVHSALLKVAGGTIEVPVEAPKPAVPVKKSVTPDYIVCLEDGKKFKSLKRHLRTQYNMTPRAVSREVGPARRLSDGRAELRKGALRTRQGNGSRPAAPQAPFLTRLSAGPDRK